MEPSAHFGMQCAAYEEEEEAFDSEEEEEGQDVDDKEREEEEDYSFSLSGFLDEDAFGDPAMLSTRALEDSISFTFSIDNASEMRECGPCDFPSTSPLLKHAHTCGLGSSSMTENFAEFCDDADHETAALVPFKKSGSWQEKSGSWQADSSFRHSARHRESRRSFSFLTDKENEEQLSEESLIQFRSATKEKDLRMRSSGEDHVTRVAASPCGDDEGKLQMHKGHNDRNGDQDVLQKHATWEQDDRKVDNAHKRGQNTGTGHSHVDLYMHHANTKDSDYGLLLPDQSHAEPNLRFAGEGLLQPWSSSKLSKSGKRRVNAERSNSQSITHHSSHDSPNSRHLHPSPLYSPTHGSKDDFSRKPGTRSSRRMRSSEGALFLPTAMGEVGSPMHEPICMPRKNSSLFARRMRNTSESLSLLVHDQKANSTSFAQAGLPSPSSNGSTNSSSYRTSSIGSTQSSGYSSSSGRCSTPNYSRNSSKITVHASARRSLQQRMDAEPFKLQKQEGPNAKPQRKSGDPIAQLHSKGNAAQSKVKTDPNGAELGVMSPSMASSQSPRSPLSWRAVLSLQPLNPSHVPVNQWAKSGSRSRSRSLSRGSSGREGRTRNPSMSAATSKELILMHSKHRGKKASSVKGGKSPASNQKLVKTRRGYWALNPLQWFKHCRNEKQVVDTITDFNEPKEQTLMGPLNS